eukprot:194507_1
MSVFHQAGSKMANHCLVCGNQKSGKQFLINELISNAQFEEINKNHKQCDWKISNKYYASDITLSIINSIDLLKTNQNTFEECQETNDVLSNLSDMQFSAIILVLNLNQSHHLVQKDLDRWIGALSPYSSLSECNLLIGNYAACSSSNTINKEKRKEYHQHLHNWSVDHLFEFVPSPFQTKQDVFFGPNSSLFATYDRMELGHHRINSALQCVMWPKMDRNAPQSYNKNKIQPLLTHEEDNENENDNEVKDKPHENNENNENNQIETEKDNEGNMFEIGDKVTLVDLKSKQDWNGRTAEIVGRFSKSKRRWPVEVMLDDGKTKALIKSVNLVVETVEDKEKENQEFVENMLWNNGEFEEQSLENKMSSFQSLIDEMQQVRNAAKSGTLTDQERRRRAADTAMKLISYMGLDKENKDNGTNDTIADLTNNEVKDKPHENNQIETDKDNDTNDTIADLTNNEVKDKPHENNQIETDKDNDTNDTL